MNPLSTRPNRWRPITVFNLLVGLLFSLSALGQPAFLKEGLVAYYPFNGNANDESENGNDGVMNGSFIAATNRFAEQGRSLYLNGSGSYVACPNKNEIFNTYPLTISFWVNELTHGQSIFELGNSESARWGVSLYDDSVMVKLDINSGKNYSFGPATINKGVWKQVVAVFEPNSLSAYLDGKFIGRKSALPPVYSNSQYQFYIGVDITGAPEFTNGLLDDVRIYNRALSDTEVKALYDYESTPQPLNARIATATAQVVNGFVVGATITDGGYGYVSNPVITITGGGGTGAKATTTQFNGVVTSITITNPGSGYTGTPTITIAPPPFPPRKATSTAQIVNGFVVGTKITDGGFGYDSPPAVLLVGGGGSGATAVATVANGVVTAVTITNPGTGYTSVPVVRIASPPFAPKLGIETSKVYVRMSVVLGRKYQLEASTDLNTWTTTGPAFIAQDEELVREFDVNQVGRYFRINQVP